MCHACLHSAPHAAVQPCAHICAGLHGCFPALGIGRPSIRSRAWQAPGQMSCAMQGAHHCDGKRSQPRLCAPHPGRAHEQVLLAAHARRHSRHPAPDVPGAQRTCALHAGAPQMLLGAGDSKTCCSKQSPAELLPLCACLPHHAPACQAVLFRQPAAVVRTLHSPPRYADRSGAWPALHSWALTSRPEPQMLVNPRS